MSPEEKNNRILDSDDPALYEIQTKARGPEGRVPINEELLRHAPSGNLFAFSQNAGMGWNPSELGRREFLILSTQGGIRAPDGRPLALGYHVGHWEVGLLMQAAAAEMRASGCIPYAAYCTDPCDGRTQGTPGMMDSLPYRNDAAQIFRRQIRSLPTRTRRNGSGHLRQGTACHDDGPGLNPRFALCPGSRRGYFTSCRGRGCRHRPIHWISLCPR